MKNRIQEVNGKFVVRNDMKEVIRIRDLIFDCLEQCECTTVDALTCLCLSTIEMSMIAKIEKPQLLSFISEKWEVSKNVLEQCSEKPS